MSEFEILRGDCRERLLDIPEASIDAAVTDPPYELGFMGRSWDATGVANDPAVWAEVLRVLKPGAHLFAFGGSRTYHRMACAVEDSGFELRDCLQWLYGTGFPKSLNVGGGRGTALKPGYEPIILARKPLIGTVAANVQLHGTGALNIDACRIETTDDLNGGAYSGAERKRDNYSPSDSTADASLTRLRRGVGEYVQPTGRWPANVILDEEAAAELDEQAGERKRGANPTRRGADGDRVALGRFAGQEECAAPRGAEVGGASRFFYTPKASRKERDSGGVRNTHPTVKPVALMRWLCRLVAPASGIVLDPFCGSGSTGVACMGEGLDFIGIEKEPEYAEIACQRLEAARRDAA